jgi:hypothetical protein
MVLSKDEYHKMGVPVGFGAPERKPEEEQLREAIESKQDEASIENLMQNDVPEYVQRLPPGDKARIVQFINTNLPYKTQLVKNPMTGEVEVKIIDGEIPEDLFHNFYGWLAHNSSMSNLDEIQLAVEEINLEIQEMEIVMAMPRISYTPEMNAAVRNAVHLSKLRLYQNKEGTERYLSAAEIQEDLKAYRILKSKSKQSTVGALADRVRGRTNE